jgi:peptide/nickel transport system permease protein
VFSRLLVGARSSMLGPLAVVAISVTAGSLLAIIAAWRRGPADAAISAGLDILFAFPGILLAVLAAAVFGAGLTAAALALSVAYMPYVARVLRGAASAASRTWPRWGAGRQRHRDLPAAPDPQHRAAGCRAGLICSGTPWSTAISFLGLGVQPRPQLGRDDRREPDRHPRAADSRSRQAVHRGRGDRLQRG